mmetsp:Transcript_11753/g.22348  ORF Transcript_11753/g.22348 Transcript_11753/m.22348 type:complete len:264 (+) Transcript_11753:2-793(+)
MHAFPPPPIPTQEGLIHPHHPGPPAMHWGQFPGVEPGAPHWTGAYDAYGQPVFVDPSMAYQHPDAQAYMQAAVAFQANNDPSYQELLAAQAAAGEEPTGMTQAEKDAGLGSVFKRNDDDLKQRRETDVRERDPSFVSDSYSECYPGYQEYSAQVVSDDDEDLTQMDAGRNRGSAPHRNDFANEDDWERYNEKRESMPRAAFQFGIKAADGRRSKKQKDQKLNVQMNKINNIIKTRKENEGAGGIAGGMHLFKDNEGGGKRQKL